MSDQAYMFGLGILAVAVLLNVVVIRLALWPIQARLDRIITLELWRYQREEDDVERPQSRLKVDHLGGYAPAPIAPGYGHREYDHAAASWPRDFFLVRATVRDSAGRPNRDSPAQLN